MEYQREVARQPQEIEGMETSRAFVAGLRAMSVDFDQMVDNFAWCAGQIAGSKDAPERIIGMMEFAVRYKQFGMDEAVRAVTENSGVEASMGLQGSPATERGIVIGFADAHYGPKDEPLFDGIAVVANRKGQEVLVTVTIATDGRVVINGEENQLDDKQTRDYIRELSKKKRK